MDDDELLAQYERSQQLQHEWDHLRHALEQVDRSDSDAPARLQAIRDRMAIITADMAAILHRTQNEPSPYRPPHYSARRRHIIQRTYSSTSDEADVSPCPSLSSLPHAPAEPIPVLDSDDLDDHQLRRTLMRDAPHHPVITVEHDPAARPRFQHLADIKRSFKDKIRGGAGSGSGSGSGSAGALPHMFSAQHNDSSAASSGHQSHSHHHPHHHRHNHSAAKSDDNNTSSGTLPLPEPVDLATITMEEATSPDDSSARHNGRHSAHDIADAPLTPASVAHRLGAVSVGMERQPGSMARGVAADAMMPATMAALPSAARGGAGVGDAKGVGVGPVSPVTNEGSGDEDDAARGARTLGANMRTHANANGGGSGVDDRSHANHNGRSSNYNALNHNTPMSSSSASGGRRRKGWQAIDSKIKALGRLTVVRKSIGRAASMTMGPGTHGAHAHTSANGTGSGSGSGEENGAGLTRMRSLRRRERERDGDAVFAETAERLAERGEKLSGVAEESEQMASDAGDMLAAVRALRQRTEGRGRFG